MHHYSTGTILHKSNRKVLQRTATRRFHRDSRFLEMRWVATSASNAKAFFVSCSPVPNVWSLGSRHRAETFQVAKTLCNTKPHWLPCGARMSSVADFEIQSPKNPRVKDVKALLRRRQREKEQKVVLEGQRLISDALRSGALPREFYYTKEAIDRSPDNAKLRDVIVQGGAKSFAVSDSVVRSFSDTVNPQGLVAVFDKPQLDLPGSPTMTLICDEIRDPGNLGTLLRSASGAGVHSVLLTSGCADAWSLKALRSGMGAQFRIPTRSGMSWPEIAEYSRSTGSLVRVADGASCLQYTDVDWGVPSALVIGSEAAGPSEGALAAADEKVAIPMSRGVESLNAAMAGTIILFEAKRQRKLSS